MKTILVPVDFSTVTRAVVAAASRLALTQQARIVLLNVTQPPVVSTEYAPYLESIGELVALSQKAALQQLERLARYLRRLGITTEIVNPVGGPAAVILKQAAALKAAYIVLGSHGHTAFYDLLVGSTAHGVLHRARCPVVVVPSPRPTRVKPRPPTRSQPDPERHLNLL